jgi:RHS repeat-associated protein
MLMDGRHGQAASSDYRYGFQGQEDDPEIKGEGNSTNYKYRMHDPRIGRFFAVDPLSPQYPHYSPYGFSGNHVINSVELEGLEDVEVFNSTKSGSVYKRTYTDKDLNQDVRLVVHWTAHGQPASYEFQTPNGGTTLRSFNTKSDFNMEVINALMGNRTEFHIAPIQGSDAARNGFFDGVADFGTDFVVNGGLIDMSNPPTRLELLKGMGIGTLDVISGGKVTQTQAEILAAQGDMYGAGHTWGYNTIPLLAGTVQLGVGIGISPGVGPSVITRGSSGVLKSHLKIMGDLGYFDQLAHGNSLNSLKPTWGYKLYEADGSFLKNGITSKAVAESRYTKSYMTNKFMETKLFDTRRAAYNWEYSENQVHRGPLNLNMH